MTPLVINSALLTLNTDKVIVIIVTYNALNWIKKCLDSLFDYDRDLSVLVIDNHSEDSTQDYIKENYSNVQLIENFQNIGFGKANNIGLKIAIEKEYEFVFLLNQDAWIKSDTIPILINASKNNPQAGVISPLQLNGAGNSIDKNFSNCIPYKSIKDVSCALESDKSQITVDFVNAAAWLIPINVVKTIGGFDPIFDQYGEDRDYVNRLYYHKNIAIVECKSIIYHDRNYRSNSIFRNYRHKLFSAGLATRKTLGMVYGIITSPLLSKGFIKRSNILFI